ncbi:MAG: OmpA family protein [Rhodobacteraceae bacterium]|nr:OmpA family protein [Paracoccaceae bacterium]
MRLSSLFISMAALLLAVGLCLVAASFAVSAVETRTEINVREILDKSGHTWAEVEADGLKVILSGTAPDEAVRFSAKSLIGSIIDAARIIDAMQIKAQADIVAPRFSAEVLRNDSGISIIGLIPVSTDRVALMAQLGKIDKEGQVSDLLQVARYPVPRGWQDAMDFAVVALDQLPRSKISISAGQVMITAISEDIEAKRRLEAELTRAAPPGLRLALDISAPRPVITPFTLRFLIDGNGARFDACSADSITTKAQIMLAAKHAGLERATDCTIGMGAPSPTWARAAALSMRALAKIGAGTVTMSNADITLVAQEGTDVAMFDRIIGELQTSLPPVFALQAVVPQPADEAGTTGPSEFTATLSPEGLVQLRGRVGDASLRDMTDAYAKARFGSDKVYTATRIVDGLPANWPVRVLAGLETLSYLVNGSVIVTADTLVISGISEREKASSDIATLLAAKLGGAGTFALDITYRKPPDPVELTPAPDVCEIELAAVQSEAKISFEPGSATIAAGALDTMNALADILNKCGEIRLEIQGHTDSQGREAMNQSLSQARAQSVLNELRSRRVITSTYVAVGYGESMPIADNGTEEGREDNRRIEFRLIRPDLPIDLQTVPETTLESTAQEPGAEGEAAEEAAEESEEAPAASETDDTTGEDPESDKPAPPQSEAEDASNGQN